MPDTEKHEATTALLGHTRGDPGSAERLMPMVYDKLRKLAAGYMRSERAGHTLQPTALVHEAYLRMIEIDRVEWNGKTHFYAMAARQMRRILVDHARAASAKKRGRAALRVTLDDGVAIRSADPVALIALDDALGSLAAASPRQSQVAELRLFAGMEVKEIAHALGVSERTVKSDWRFARVWLMRELGDEPTAG